jgi:hypothetical protein
MLNPHLLGQVQLVVCNVWCDSIFLYRPQPASHLFKRQCGNIEKSFNRYYQLLELGTRDVKELEHDLVGWLQVTQHGELVDHAAKPHGKRLDTPPPPSQKSSTSYSRRTFWALAFLMRSSPICITLILSHTSRAESFVASVVIISDGTTLQIASSAMQST